MIIVCLIWAANIIDLVFYYYGMDFPQDKSFKRAEKKSENRLHRWSRRLQWLVILFNLLMYCGYIGLFLVWLLLGAIINPNSFLPFTSAAITLIAFVRTKYKKFKEISERGTELIKQYLEKMFTEIMNKVLGKVIEGITKSIDFASSKKDGILSNGTFSLISTKLAATGLIDE